MANEHRYVEHQASERWLDDLHVMYPLVKLPPKPKVEEVVQDESPTPGASLRQLQARLPELAEYLASYGVLREDGVRTYPQEDFEQRLRDVVVAFDGVKDQLSISLRHLLRVHLDQLNLQPVIHYPRDGQRPTPLNRGPVAEQREIDGIERASRALTQELGSNGGNAPRLLDRHVEAMQAMENLKAFHRSSRKAAREIAAAAYGEPNAYLVKETLADLARRKYAESVRGRAGGSYLTERGRERLQQEKPKQ